MCACAVCVCLVNSHLAHAAVLLHSPLQCMYPGIRAPLLRKLLTLQQAETDYEFDDETMDSLLEIRDWCHLASRCAASIEHNLYCTEGSALMKLLRCHHRSRCDEMYRYR